MKLKSLITIAGLVGIISLSSCKTGNFSTVSGQDDKAYIYFASDGKLAGKEVIVDIDGKTHFDYKVLKLKNDKVKPNSHAQSVAPGRHSVKVSHAGKQIYNSEIFLSTQTSKIINL